MKEGYGEDKGAIEGGVGKKKRCRGGRMSLRG